jgi:hypothetical protein
MEEERDHERGRGAADDTDERGSEISNRRKHERGGGRGSRGGAEAHRKTMRDGRSVGQASKGFCSRSKTETAMRNETLRKFICHNICCTIQEMHESGFDPTRWALPAVG